MRENPVFILSQSPRSGSTWLQRVLTSTRDILIWGEGQELNMGETWAPEDPEDPKRDKYPSDLHKFRVQGSAMWMAILRPLEKDMMRGRRSFLHHTFGNPAKAEGYERWGLKETAWDDTGVRFCLDMYQDSKVIFLCRSFDLAFASQFKDKEDTPQLESRSVDIDRWCHEWVYHSKMILKYQGHPKVCVCHHHQLHSDELGSLCKWCGLGEPDPEEIKREISVHPWAAYQDIHTKSPGDLQALWKYRDNIISLSSQLGYEVTL